MKTIDMKYWCFLLILLAGISCQDDTWVEPADTNNTRSEGYATLTVQVPGINTAKTYAGISETQENDIHEIDVLAFVEGEDGKEYFSYRIVVNKNDIKTDENRVNRKTFDLHLKRLDEGVRLMILGNSFSALNALDPDLLTEGTPYEAIVDALTFRGDFWEESEISNFENPFPMWGETQGKIYATAESDRVVINEVVKLLRAVARIDIGVDIYGDPALGFGKRFRMEEVIVYRASRSARLIPDASVMENNQVNAPTLVWTEDNTVEKADPFSFRFEPGADEKTMERKIYLSESAACVKEKEKEGTCLVIGAVFNGGDKTYYRIDFINNDQEYIPLLRNHKYLINITAIAKDGYATPEEAANARSSSIQYELEVTEENINDVTVGNEYTLGVSSSLVTLDWYEGVTAKISVLTEYSKGWTAAITEGADWLSITSTVGETQPEVVGELHLKATSQNRESRYRYGAITFTAGELRKTVRIRQQMGSNCYIVSTNGKVNLPVAYANADTKTRVTANQPVSATLLWMDGVDVIQNVQVSGSGTQAIIEVQTGTQEGNAVVAATDLAGNAIWSWHIWVTNGNPEAQLTYHNGHIFMDRNLGALQATPGGDSFGLLYQWGRKDPFPGADPVTSEERRIYDLHGEVQIELLPVTAIDNMEQAIANPATFYTSAVAPYYSWTGTGTSNNLLWNDEEGNKTPYDPCPDGWRVPVSGGGTLSPWQGLTAGLAADFAANRGWIWKSGYYPATGCRMSDTGNLADVSSRGFVWSATPYAVNAYLFRYGNSANSVNASAANYRANGYAVRCVKE